ncbi:MAG: glycosyltransferase involved in cell wall biosynthesis [Candidatus Omnitrophota bacterium]|jgi:glycosyltransferase involved in cell wall biosynthesis
MTIQNNFSIVIPLYNESKIFEDLKTRVVKACESTQRVYEVIFVDDGSSDNSLDLIRTAAKQNPSIKYLSFSRNFGHQVAVSAGIQEASQDAVIVMDGDLQDPPELIGALLKKWEEGFDVIYAVRKRRKENALLKFCYFTFYRILQMISEIHIPLDAGDFCLMDRKVVNVLKSMPERNRYVRGIRAWAGFRQVALPYDRDARAGGETKYSFAKLLSLATSGITSFSQFPLRLCGYLGYSIALVSSLGFAYGLISKVFFDQTPQGWASTTMAIFFIGGVQLVMLSVVGSYVGRIYTEVQGRPLYVVQESNVQAP